MNLTGIKSFIKNYFLFFIFSFLALSFLIFQKWYWLYVDSAWWPMSFERYEQLIQYSLNSFSNITYFGFDSSTVMSSRFLQTLTKILPMGVLYFSFFVFSFLSSYYLLKIKFSKQASFYWALLFTFNPVSLYFLKQVGYLYSYFSLPLIILSVYYFFQTYKTKYILWLALWVIFFISYTRLTWIYLLFFILLALYYHTFVINIFKTQKKNITLIWIIIILVSSPFLLSLIFPHFSWDKQYFSWLWNYADSFDAYQKTFYKIVQNESFFNSFYIREIVHDFADNWNKWNIFIISSLILILLNIFYFLYSSLKTRYTKFWLYLLLILLFIISIKAGAKFFPFEVYSVISYKYFPFIANNTNWLYLIYVPILVYIFAYNFTYCPKSVHNKLLMGSCLYVLLSIFPLINFYNNTKVQLVNTDQMSENFDNTFQKSNTYIQPTLYFPQSTLYIKWNPYHIKLHNNNNYVELLHNDKRSVNRKQQDLRRNIYRWNMYNKENLAIFNLKNIFVFKNIQNVKNGTFDWYRWEQFEEKSIEQYNELNESPHFYKRQDNNDFAQFRIKNDLNYDYFIYSPAEIVEKEINSLYKNKLEIENKIVLIDSKSFHKPENIDSFSIPQKNKNIQIDYKKSQKNTTKYYLKISNLDKNFPFLIQLNQTFWMSWKLKWISESEYSSKKCIDDFIEYSITDNSVCNYQHSYLNILNDYKYISKKEVKEMNHFEGNFVWNTWLVESDDLPQNLQENEPLYAVIIYEKQIYYTWTLIISWLTFLVLMLLSIIQEIKIYFTKKDTKWTSLKK